MALFLLDDYLTVLVARRYDEQGDTTIEFQGGYELTPQYQQEIAEHRLFGPAFIRSLVILTAVLVLIRIMVQIGWLPVIVFQFIAGAMILTSCAVNIRHAQNLVFFGIIPIPERPIGRISYPRSFSYRGSAVGFLAFGLFCLLLSLILGSWFMLGGAFACSVTAISHWRLSNRPPRS
jgi:hypothetical protein